MNSIINKKSISIGLLIILLGLYPLIVKQSSYYMTILVMVFIYAISAVALDLLVGFGGQISVGHAGFLIIGAYTVAIFSSKYELSIILALPLAGLIAGIIGFIIGLPAVKLSGQFLAVVTLGFGLSIPQLALNWDTLTNGYSGLAVYRPSFIADDFTFFYVVLALTVFIMWIIHNILHGRFGRVFVAIRESEVAAQSTGVHLAFYKAIMFAISAFFTGLAGGIYAYWIGFVSPNDFTIITSFLLLGMIVVGGLASMPGAIAGAIVFTALPEVTSSFIGLTNIIIGGAIVLMIIFRPRGLMAGLPNLFTKKKTTDVKSSNLALREGKVE